MDIILIYFTDLIQAALDYITIRYKLNPFKTFHEVQAGVNWSHVSIPSCLYPALQPMHHARHGAKRKVILLGVLQVIARQDFKEMRDAGWVECVSIFVLLNVRGLS